MIKYKFLVVKRNDIDKEVPFIEIDEKSIKGADDYMFLTEEINNLSENREYIKEIVQELEEVVAGTRDKCLFGFETTLIWCYKKGYKSPNGNIYPKGKVAITYDYGDKELATDLKAEDILKMMKDWRDYIESWEKKIGKKYNGI